MGKPAARLSDMTAHGGAITVGCPTVMIGGLPAARLGDMHMCPMVTPGVPPIPHVGGPVSMSSAPTVLAGGVPIACVGDMLVCTGPPDTIIPPGCPTVMVGSGGGGGGGGGGGSGGSGSGATATAESAEAEEGHFFHVSFVDKGGFPVDGLAYSIKLPDGITQQGILTGLIRRGGAQEGSHEIQLRGIIDARWSKKSAKAGDTVTMKVKTAGIESGTPAKITIWVKDANFSSRILKSIDASVSSDAIEQDWTLEVDEALLGISREKEAVGGYSYPWFFFVVTAAGLSQRSGLLGFADKIEFTLKDQDGNPMPNRPYRLRLPTGEVREGKTDGSGHAVEDDIPPGGARLSYNVRKQ